MYNDNDNSFQVYDVAVTLIVLLVLMVVFFGITGLMKVLRHPHRVQEFERFAYPCWLARLADTIERTPFALLLAGFATPA